MQARGVFDDEARARLVQAAAHLPALGRSVLEASDPLPGVPATWTPEDSNDEVLEVSRRLVLLQEMLGGADGGGASSTSAPTSPWAPAGSEEEQRGVNVTWMVVREPGLLTADYNKLMRRLIDMKVID